MFETARSPRWTSPRAPTATPNNSPPLGDVTWINGILNPNNSEYFEGVSTLQRVFFDDIVATAGNAHTLTFTHQAGKAGCTPTTS